MRPRPAAASLVSILAVATAALLGALQLQWGPVWRHAWGFNTWGYLPAAWAFVFAAVAVALCHPVVREGVARLSTRAAAAFSARAGEGLLFAAALLFFWLFRERRLVGDSQLMMLETGYHDRWFVVPEMGSTFLMWASLRVAKWGLGLAAPDGYRFVVCLAGGLCVLFLLRLARRLAPGRAGALALLVLSGGLLRIFAGHVENYGPVLAALSAYFWLALEHLEGRRSWVGASLALGVAVWLHGATLLLVPSLLALPLLCGLRPAPAAAAAARGLFVAALPSLVFLAVMAMAGRFEELSEAWVMGQNVIGLRDDPGRVRMWVRFWGSGPSVGTDVVFLSGAHLKFLINASWILAPFALPTLGLALLRGGRKVLDTPAARLLGVALVPLTLYSLLLRPFWGPFDWDLFSVPAFCASLLAAHWLSRGLETPAWRHTSVWIVGFQLVFVGLPFLLLGIVELRDAGPFAPGYFEFELLEMGRDPPPRLAPWL